MLSECTVCGSHTCMNMWMYIYITLGCLCHSFSALCTPIVGIIILLREEGDGCGPE
jgi:hypothetical protein